MSGALAVLLILAVAAAALGIRSERRRRTAAERHAAVLEERAAELARRADSRADSLAGYEREWLAVLGHELRSPLSAILGYAELLEDGTFGELAGRAGDAVRRMRASAEQLNALIDGMDSPGALHDSGTAVVDTAVILREAADAVTVEADARHVRIVVDDGALRLRTRPGLAARALRLALGAAIKVGEGGELRLFVEDGAPPRLVIAGTRLDLQRDDPEAPPEAGHRLTGAGFRIALARRAARQLGGSVQLRAATDGTSVVLDLSSSIDSAEDRP